MAFAIPFANYTPSARRDGRAWKSVRVDEAPPAGSPWSAIETIALHPVDPDPSHPLTRSFETTQATLTSGWYRVVFLDDFEGEQLFEPVFNGGIVRPRVVEVATLMPDRTTGSGGLDTGTFTDLTFPTAAQVETLIDMVLDTVEPRVSMNAGRRVLRAARSIVTLHVAILVEATYFSQQGEVHTERIELWERLIAQHTATLDAAAVEEVTVRARFGSVGIGTLSS